MTASLPRLFSALVRVGLAEAVAYRAEFVVWFLTTNMPVVMWLLWSRVAQDAPIAGYSATDFGAYFLLVAIVRLLTGVWVAWQINDEIRTGVLSRRLLRPMHAFWHYAAENVGAWPLRVVILSPVIALAVVTIPASHVTDNVWQWASVPVSIVGAWSVAFTAALLIGTVGFFFQNSQSLMEVWLGLYFICSGYTTPLDLFPDTLRRVFAWLPFPYMLGLPVQSVLKRITPEESWQGVGMQLIWSSVFLSAALLMWNRGLRRYEAYGG